MLHDTFGFKDFRALQEEAVEAAVAGRDLLMVMPTGAGKSLCFQLPAAVETGVTLVVSPLVALMRDQVEALNSRTAFKQLGCGCINFSQSNEEQWETMQRLREGRLRLLYVAPERFRSAGFMETILSVPVARFVVDEAHCISEWGHDFRPDYLTLQAVIEGLGRPPLTAVTATATPRVQESIVRNLGMRDPAEFVGGFNRPNLHLSVHRFDTEADREEKLRRALPGLAAMGGSGLIYVTTRKQCEAIAEMANGALQPVGATAGPYHAGMEAAARNRLQSGWLAGEVKVLVATNAFGMGIDKPDVRFVVHVGYPETLENYYQEAGRAGRDSGRSRCVILYHFSDRRTREWFIENDAVTTDGLQQAHAALIRLAEGDVAQIGRALWAQQLKWSENKTKLTLGLLEREGLVERLAETADDMTVRVKERSLPAPVLQKMGADLERQRQERYRRLKEMIDYCKTKTCRRISILKYFGDQSKVEAAAYCCDNCDAAQKTRANGAVETEAVSSNRSRAPMPKQIERGDIHALLQGLDALFPTVGKARLNKVLRGTDTKFLERAREKDCPVYGIFRGCAASEVDGFLVSLITKKLMVQGDEDEYFVLTVTPAGRLAWKEKHPLEIPVPQAFSRGEIMDDTANEELFERLRKWRRGEADSANLPPYCILSDRALLEIARRKPADREALLAVPGVGDQKLSRYGDAVLRVVKETSE